MLKLFRAAMLTVATLTVSGIANAADLPVPPLAPPPHPVYVAPVFTWTGVYVGGNLGVVWTKGHVTDSSGVVGFDYGQNAVFTVGGQIGANYQFNDWLVVGAEADFDWLANNNNSTNTAPATGIPFLRVSANDRWITTLAARIGIANNNLLYYAKGGGGWVGANNFTITNVNGSSISFSNSNSNTGWLAGAGIEWAFAPNWTAKLEYDFLGLNNQSFTVPAGSLVIPGDVITTTSRDIQMLTVGVNYLFNWHY